MNRAGVTASGVRLIAYSSVYTFTGYYIKIWMKYSLFEAKTVKYCRTNRNRIENSVGNTSLHSIVKGLST